MKKNKRNILLIGLISLLVIGSGVAATTYYYLFAPQFLTTETAYIYIDRDDTIDSIANKVRAAGLPQSMRGFHWLSTYYNYAKEIHTGRYAIRPHENMFHLFHLVSQGRQEPINLSISSVRTRGRLARSIGKQLMIDSTEIAQRLFDSTFCAQMGYREETIVCLFVPNTYQVYWDMSADEFFHRMKKEQKAFWTDQRLAQATSIGLTPEEVCTLASIVEEETNNDQEKPLVAGLYMNRLQKGIRLQADPTVKFGLQEFGLRRIRGSHLTVDSPYNTYKNKGLPPGPIRIPSIKGIDSVLNYAKHNFIYMCAKEDFSGTHRFSANYSEHQANAKKYWKALNERNIK